jgi:hypothetical protein
VGTWHLVLPVQHLPALHHIPPWCGT